MRPSPYEPAILAFLADGKPRTLREIGAAAGCKNPSRIVAKMQRAIRLRREKVKLVKGARGTGRNVLVTWRIIGPLVERQRLIDKGIEAGISICSKKKLHGMEGKRNRALEQAENLSDSRVTVPTGHKTILETIATIENRSVAACVREALGQWVAGKVGEHGLRGFK
jgi:hypothetical protein